MEVAAFFFLFDFLKILPVPLAVKSELPLCINSLNVLREFPDGWSSPKMLFAEESLPSRWPEYPGSSSPSLCLIELMAFRP